MKTEHFEAIERAKMHGVMPSVLAHELLVRDLVEASMFEWQNIAAPFNKLNEGQRQEVIDRVTEKVTTAVYTAVGIISSRSVDTIPLTVADAKFKAKSITVTATIDAQDPNRHGLIDVAGSLFPAGGSGSTGPDEPDGEHPLGNAAELAERTGGSGNAGADLGKEFGEFTYDDAAQLIVLKSNNKAFKAHWIQSRLAIDSDKAASLLIRLLDNGVIELEGEGETAMDHSYKVIATLADVT